MDSTSFCSLAERACTLLDNQAQSHVLDFLFMLVVHDCHDCQKMRFCSGVLLAIMAYNDQISRPFSPTAMVVLPLIYRSLRDLKSFLDQLTTTSWSAIPSLTDVLALFFTDLEYELLRLVFVDGNVMLLESLSDLDELIILMIHERLEENRSGGARTRIANSTSSTSSTNSTS